MSKHRQWHVNGWRAVLLAPVAIPIAILIKLAEFFGLKTTASLTAADVSSYLDDFINERAGDWDWDDFTSVAVTDPRLEKIRAQAATVKLPLDADGEAKIKELLTLSRQLEAAHAPTSV